jgi:hypothetical protein
MVCGCNFYHPATAIRGGGVGCVELAGCINLARSVVGDGGDDGNGGDGGDDRIPCVRSCTFGSKGVLEGQPCVVGGDSAG